MIDGYEKHTCTECETMFTSNEELHQHHIIDHGVALTESTVEWNDITPEDQVEEAGGEFTTNGKPITFSDEDEKLAREYLSETAELQKVQIASEQRLKMARDQIRATNMETDEFYEQILGESNGQDFSSGAGTINPLDTPKFKYSKNNKLADTIHTKGYNPNPNAGLYNNKEFKEGGDHLEDPLAKEDFEVSFYGGESKASEKYGELTSKQKNVLNNWLSSRKEGIGMSWEANDLPYDIFSQLEEIQDSEYLYSAITNHVQDIIFADEAKASEFTSDDTLSNIWNNMDANHKADVLEYFEDSDEFVGNNVDNDFYSIARKLGIASDKFKEDVEEFDYLINESKASEGFSSSLDFDEPYPDPECKICGKVMINVWGDTRDAQDWGKIEQAIQEHYIGVHGDDATTQELSDNEIMQQNIIFWGESKANEDDEYEYGFIPKVSGFGEDKDENLPIKDHTHNFTSGYQHSNGIDYIWQCSDSGCGATKNQDLYMESKANEWESGNKNVHANFHIIIKNRNTGKVAEDMTAGSLREAESIMSGASMNMNHADWEIVIEQGESKASEDQHTDAWDEKYGQDLCPICKDSGNCNSMVFHAKLWNDVKEKPANEFKFGEYEVKCDCDKDPDCKTCGGKGTNTWSSTVGKSDESLKADWDDSEYEEKYSWLKDLGVDDSYKYANMTLYELPENIWSKVNEDYVNGFKQIMAESYTPDQQNVIETAEEKIISRKLDGTPVGQIARELVLWNDFSEEHATKLVGEVEPSDNDMVAKTLFNKRYSECSESEIQEMELYDA